MGRWRRERSWTGQVWGRWGDEEGGKGGWKRISWKGGGVRLKDEVSLFVQEKVRQQNIKT